MQDKIFLEMDNLWNSADLLVLITKFIANLLVVLILVRVLYYGRSRQMDYVFSYVLISIVVFLLCFMLGNVKLQLGFALGLFAIFGIIRFRTTTIPVREMTYLFLVIGISVINSLAGNSVSLAELVFSNLAIILTTAVFERLWLTKGLSSKTILYENIELIKASRQQELISDLSERMEVPVTRVEIGQINYLRDTARLKVYFRENERFPAFKDQRDTTDED